MTAPPSCTCSTRKAPTWIGLACSSASARTGRCSSAILILFQFAYPDRRADIPDEVMDELTERLQCQRPEPDNRVCRGTLLSDSSICSRSISSVTLTHAFGRTAR